MASVTRTTVWVDNQVLNASDLNGEFNNLLNALNIVNADISAGAGIVYSKLNLSGSIVNSDISSSAAIAYSKLNLAGSIQSSDLSGGVAYSKLNLSGSIQNSDISSSAGIQYSKLSLTGSIINSDISSSAAIAYSKLNLSGSILNTDLAGSISPSKITGTAAVLTGNSYSGLETFLNTAQTLTTDLDGATVTFNLSLSNVHTVTLGGNRTLAVSNATVGQAFMINLIQDGNGSRTVTWFSTIKWPGTSAPTLTTTAGRTDSFLFLCTSSGNYNGYIAGQNLG